MRSLISKRMIAVLIISALLYVFMLFGVFALVDLYSIDHGSGLVFGTKKVTISVIVGFFHLIWWSIFFIVVQKGKNQEKR